jgi:hypothetical protein
MATRWIKKFNSWIADRASMPGVWRMRDGGYLVRGRAVNPKTGKLKEVRAALVEVATPDEANLWLQGELRKVRVGSVEVAVPKTRFSDYAVSLLER